MWKLAMPAVAALVATIATASAGAGGAPRPEPRALGPGALLTRLVADMAENRYQRAWLTLHPAHQRAASRWEYAACERLVPFGRLVSVQVLDVAYEPVDVPGLPRLEPGAAVMVRIELWAPEGQPPLVIHHTAHVVRAGGGWRWMLPAPTFDDYRADRCAADPSA